MPGRILIEEHDATAFGLPTGAKHLYLVYQDILNGAEYVIRSGPPSAWQPVGGEMEIEINVPMAQSADDRDGDTAAQRSSTELSFPGLTPDQAWSIMVQYARAIDAEDYGYSLLEENSNAFVGSLLYAAHGAPGQMLPHGTTRSEAVGFSHWPDIVRDVSPPADWVFRGTAAADVVAGLQMDEVFDLLGGPDTLTAGRGNDVARGGAGPDRIYGEEGDDRLLGQGQADLLWGGYGNDELLGGGRADRLTGGPGTDILAGGPGNDVLSGGQGADFFDFGPGEGRDVITDFRVGVDQIRIQAPAVQRADDIVLGVQEGDVSSAFDRTEVVLDGIAPAGFDLGAVVVLPDTLLS